MAKKKASKLRAQQRSRRRIDPTVRRTGVTGGSAISDGMAEAREKAATAMQAATVQLTTSAVASAASTISGAAVFSPPATKKS